MNNEREMYPPKIKNSVNSGGEGDYIDMTIPTPTEKICYCCKKEKQCTYIKLNEQNIDNEVPVCNSCNHLKPSMDANPDHITIGEK